VYFVTSPPIYLKVQRDEKDPDVKKKDTVKLAKARERCYIGPGQVVSLTSFFAVPKGKDDIRMVYDGSVSGLNDDIWVPGFTLPTVHTHLRAVEAGTFMVDVDVGGVFLNFMLHSSIRPFAGLDISHFFAEDPKDVKRWETWYRAAMGLTSSPYQACQAMGYAEEVMRGNRLNGSNVFRWDRVRLNLPGSEAYRPDLPWVSKVRDSDGRVAADIYSFVDDLRPTGPTKRDAWKAARKSGSTLSYLGLQDASRKRRSSSMTPGAWAGSLLRSDDGQVRILTAQDKWEKAKALIKETQALLVDDANHMPQKRLEQIRGFLNCVCQTYPILSSYLIGYHMTIDLWRQGQDKEGWRLRGQALQKAAERANWAPSIGYTEGPQVVCNMRTSKKRRKKQSRVIPAGDSHVNQ
jgi:hypothetical protein